MYVNQMEKNIKNSFATNFVMQRKFKYSLLIGCVQRLIKDILLIMATSVAILSQFYSKYENIQIVLFLLFIEVKQLTPSPPNN